MKPWNPDTLGGLMPLAGALVLLAWGLVPTGLASGPAARVRETLRCDLLSATDYEQIERGYYERLLDDGRRLGSSGEVPHAAARQSRPRASDEPFEAGPLAQPVGDLREFVLKPNAVAKHRGARWTTNAQGLRDLPYEIAKPPHTFRIALVGDSIAAGWGVDDGRGFEPTLERVLDERSRATGGPAVEIVNYSAPGYGPGARWDHFARLGWPMGPDLVVFETTQADVGWDERRLRGLLPKGIGWDSPLYRDALSAAGVTPGASAETYKRELRPYRGKILAGVYRAAAADCRSRGVPCVWVMVPRVGKAPEPLERERVLGWARAAGFAAVVDLSDAYDGLDSRDLAIGPGDYHPNADGHARLARLLDEALSARPELQALWTARAKVGGGAPSSSLPPGYALPTSLPGRFPAPEGRDRKAWGVSPRRPAATTTFSGAPKGRQRDGDPDVAPPGLGCGECVSLFLGLTPQALRWRPSGAGNRLGTNLWVMPGPPCGGGDRKNPPSEPARAGGATP